jgi:hypothetical protein
MDAQRKSKFVFDDNINAVLVCCFLLMHRKLTWFLLRALRILLREIVRCLRHDLNIPHFCLNLMMDRMRDKFDTFRDFEYKVSSWKELYLVAIPGLKSRKI